MADNGRDSGELTARQLRAVAALLTARNARDAAKAAGVGERTLYRWLADLPEFRAAIAKAEEETIEAASRRLLVGQAAALDTLETIMGKAEKDADRRLAAAAWLDFALRWRELRSFEERLAALEAINAKT